MRNILFLYIIIFLYFIQNIETYPNIKDPKNKDPWDGPCSAPCCIRLRGEGAFPDFIKFFCSMRTFSFKYRCILSCKYKDIETQTEMEYINACGDIYTVLFSGCIIDKKDGGGSIECRDKGYESAQAFFESCSVTPCEQLILDISNCEGYYHPCLQNVYFKYQLLPF